MITSLALDQQSGCLPKKIRVVVVVIDIRMDGWMEGQMTDRRPFDRTCMYVY